MTFALDREVQITVAFAVFVWSVAVPVLLINNLGLFFGTILGLLHMFIYFMLFTIFKAQLKEKNEEIKLLKDGIKKNQV